MGIEAAFVGKDRRIQTGGKRGHCRKAFPRDWLLYEGRAETFDITQHADRSKGFERLVVVEAEIDRVPEGVPHRLEVCEVFAMGFHAGLDLEDAVSLGNHLLHPLHVGSEIGIGD
ncbi:hypothetical protein D3C86_1701790 [compost metagenome]